MAKLPLNKDIILSPIWEEDPIVRVVWITVLSLQNSNGEILSDEDHIQRKSLVPYDQFKPAFNYLLGNDIADGENSPKRIQQIEGGYKIRAAIKANQPVNKQDTTPLWKKNTEEGYKEYLTMVDTAFYSLMDDIEWFEKTKEIYPKVLIGASLEKAYHEFWGTKSGWNNKRNKKYKSIDWKRTAVNIIKYNPVYCSKGKEDHEFAYIARKKRELCL